MTEPTIIPYNSLEHTDSYKIGHWKQFPPDLRALRAYWESRYGIRPEITFAGLQYILKSHLVGQQITEDNIQEAKEDYALHFGRDDVFNEHGIRKMMHRYGGRWPVKIMATLEGTTVPISNAMMVIQSLDEDFPWPTTFVETILSHVWYPSTIATNCRMSKKMIVKYLVETGCDPNLADFMLNDFGFRGVGDVAQAGIGGFGHLIYFKGTDNMRAIRVCKYFYHERMAGFSIPAMEHSTVTSWRHEVDAFDNMLNQFPSGTIAMVIDSYDVFNACRNMICGELREKILKRNGKVVIRPDSDDPLVIIPQLLAMLGESFGFTINHKGFRVLDPHVGIIWGDGIKYHNQEAILECLKQLGWAASNIAFGSGGGLIQAVGRDDQGCTIKASAGKYEHGVWRDIYKDPITSSAFSSKKSKRGRLALIIDSTGNYKTIRIEELGDLKNQLVTVFNMGDLLIDQSLSDIRLRAQA